MADHVAMNADEAARRFSWEQAPLHVVLCEGFCEVTTHDIERFRALMGYSPTPPDEVSVAPTSMSLTYGLRLGWEHGVFPPGAVRMGDDDCFGAPARAGDRVRTELRILEKFERKNRRFMKYEMRTRNQNGDLVCSVCFTAIAP